MQKFKNLILITLIFISNLSFGQELSTKDSIATFYTAILDSLEMKYLNRDTVDWDKIRTAVKENTSDAKAFEAAVDKVSTVFDSIGCNHCLLFTETYYYGSSLNKPLSQDDFSREFLLEYQNKPPFSVKLIDGQVGYINIPGMLMLDLSQDSLDMETQKMYDAIAKLWQENEIKGWVIDLRFNIGGNVYPMLAALHSLLGDNIVYNTIDKNGKVLDVHTLRDGGFYTGNKLETKAKTSIKPNVKIPVALLTGKMTGSAGEDIAVAFKNRENVIFIGEESYGYLTGNDMYELPFNTKIALTTSYIVDINNQYRATIIPDIEVIKQDNFEDLTQDGKVIKAIEFIKTKERK